MRDGADLASAEVSRLPSGAHVTVVEERDVAGVLRLRLAPPHMGWVSAKLFASLGAHGTNDTSTPKRRSTHCTAPVADVVVTITRAGSATPAESTNDSATALTDMDSYKVHLAYRGGWKPSDHAPISKSTT